MSIDTPEYDQLTYTELLAKVDALNERVAFLICAEQERDLAIAEVAECYAIIKTLQGQLEGQMLHV